MPFGDEYPLDPVDTVPAGPELPGSGRDTDLTDLYTVGEDLEPDTVRDLVGERVEGWQRIPRLALAVQGRTGYNGSYRVAFEAGYWQVSPEAYNWSKDNLPRVYVDCASGELVSASFIRTPPIPDDAVEEDVLDALEANGDRMEREAIENELAPRYDAGTVRDAVNTMYRRGLSTGRDHAIVVERPAVSPAPDHLVERIAAHHPERLDAARTVDWLEERASEPHSDIYDAEEQEAWRDHVREQLDLGHVFTRD